MLAERLTNVQEAGKVFVEKCGGTFVNAIRAAGNNAQGLLETILEDIPLSYHTGFLTERVECYKRAQILVADVCACFEGKGFGMFTNIVQLTIFVDYCIPQALKYFGTVTYSPELQRKLESNYVFQYGEQADKRCLLLLKNELNRLISADGAKTPVQQETNIITCGTTANSTTTT
ncbi:putative UPF0553 protein C9orf64 [Hypsibius exemplaris]|uniref:Queuosine 5'-phosphate N-glycosylase/hydrolase n=1 Tax=Hypsibius exemplaris TaxID=2072580 RepID=A0A1W0WHM4_HYPEX|nr:putative UPF0553 protein C9orf64 [Hypsibius exemplaris]